MLSPEEAVTLDNPPRRRAPSLPASRVPSPGRRPSFYPALYLALCLPLCSLLSAGCHGRPPETPPPPVDPLAVAHRHFEEGNFAAALAGYESYLAGPPERTADALVLFRLAMIRLMPDSEVQDWNAARRLFERLIATYPDSPLKPEAEVVLHLQREVERLYGQLEALKRIDLGAEPPPRPRRP